MINLSPWEINDEGTGQKKLTRWPTMEWPSAIRPSHTLFDGDAVFCLATGKKELPEAPDFFPSPQAQAFNELGHAAANCMSRAIISGILSARSLAGMIAFCDLEDR